MRSRFVTAVGAGCLTLFTLVLAAQQGQTPPTQTPPATVQSGQGRGAGTGQFQGRGGRGGGPVTIKAARVLDGRGKVMKDAIITVQGSKIVIISQQAPANPIDYDLHDATVLPGLIDVHVHLNWYFGPDGHYGSRVGALAGYQADAIQKNVRDTLMAGFTTVQSVGAASDKPLREAIAAGVVVGPRILTSIAQIQGGNNTPDQLRERVRQAKAAGAV